MKKNIFTLSLLIVTTIITLDACKKKTEVDNETQSVVDNALCEQQFMAIAPNVNDKGGDPIQAGFKTTACGFTWTAPATTGTNSVGEYTAGAQTFTVDYTGSTCNELDKSPRTGKMFIKSTHQWSVVKAMPIGTQPEVTVVVTFDGYMVGAVAYNGTITVVKNNNLIKTKVENGTCTSAGWANGISYATDGFKTTEILADGTVKIWGDAHGVNREGRSFTTSIPAGNPIIKKRDCKWISSGEISVTPDGFKTRTVNFERGGGGCDNLATFTIGDQTIEFEMK